MENESKRAMGEVGFCSAEFCPSESELEKAGQAWHTPSTSKSEGNDVDNDMIEEENCQYHLNVLPHALTGWLEKVDLGEVCPPQ